MKKTILLSSVLAVGAAFAVTSTEVASTEVGVMGVAMPTKAALIAVPFLGYDTTDIVVADMVNTAELAAGSKLYVPNDSGKYDVWTLNASKQWEKTSSNVVIGNDGAESGETANANEVTTKRGGSFWLEPAKDSSDNCYLLGKPASGDGSSAVVPGKWNLIGNTSGAEVTLSQTGFLPGDRVAVPSGDYLKIYSWDKDKGWWLTRKQIEQEIKVPAGTGIWFFAAAKSSSDRTIQW